MADVRRKGLYLVGFIAAAVAGAAVLFRSKDANASTKPSVPDGDLHDAVPTQQPQTPEEVYSIGMNPNVKDAEKVHEWALWMNSSGHRPDWAAALERRAMALRAEALLSEGLKSQTLSERVTELATVLKQSGYEAYSVVLVSRLAVQRGQTPPAPFALELQSGGTLHIDLSVFAPGASGGTATASSTTQPPPAYVPSSGPSSGSGTVALPSNAPALAQEEVKPANDPNGSIALARVLLDEQSRKGWKYVSEAVASWQRKTGLTADGKFGPASALRMSREVAVLPWVRYWPTGSASKAAAISDYRGRLKAFALTLAKSAPEHAAALLIAADNETGQGWPSAPSAAPPTARPLTAADIDRALAVLATMAGQMVKK